MEAVHFLALVRQFRQKIVRRALLRSLGSPRQTCSRRSDSGQFNVFCRELLGQWRNTAHWSTIDQCVTCTVLRIHRGPSRFQW